MRLLPVGPRRRVSRTIYNLICLRINIASQVDLKQGGFDCVEGLLLMFFSLRPRQAACMGVCRAMNSRARSDHADRPCFTDTNSISAEPCKSSQLRGRGLKEVQPAGAELPRRQLPRRQHTLPSHVVAPTCSGPGLGCVSPARRRIPLRGLRGGVMVVLASL